MILSQFKDFIHQHQLINNDDKLLLAVSGGKDSVLMAHLFKKAGYNFAIAHCNFNLRGEESQRDASFVHLLSSTFDVPLHTKMFDTIAYSQAHQISIQMAARDLRYAWFEELSEEYGFTKIAIAHHSNDTIETVLINLTRGTGIAGLHGILPKNGKLIRPLLFATSEEIEAEIDKENISFVEDSSNLTTKYARNKIRSLVIPVLKEINPNLEETFLNNIERFSETEKVLNKVVSEIRNKIFELKDGIYYINKVHFKDLDPQKLLVTELLTPFNFSEGVVDLIIQNLEKPSGTSFYSPSHRLTFDRDNLLISKIMPELNPLIIWHSDIEEIDFLNGRMQVRLSDSLPLEFNSELAYIDFDALVFPLIIRNWEQGDQFIPFGMNNFKKLSDFFIDQKLPVPEKERIPILVNGNGDIIWVAGLRQDNRYKVSKATKKVAIFEWKINESTKLFY